MKQYDPPDLDRLGGGGGGGGGGPAPPQKYKHIIIGIDGTWQAAFRDPFQSNVHRMNVALNHEDLTAGRNPQLFIYSAGVGTANRSSAKVAGATGEGLSAIVLESYINLVANYKPGDRIYIFGFSRGAFAARVLTGFITYSGLLTANSLAVIEDAWRYFTDRDPRLNYPDIRSQHTHKNVKVEFLGIWDTVAGPYKKEKILSRYRFNNLKLDKIVKQGVHILSIDESRNDFAPTYFDGCREDQMLEQLWMPGVHSDIGGGYSKSFLSTLSLLTMIDKLRERCPDLSLDERYIADTLVGIIETEGVTVNNERVGAWRFIGGNLTRSIADSTHHKQHPVVGLMRDSEVFYKKAMKPYAPRFGKPELLNVGFAENSFHRRQIFPLLERKFRKRLDAQ